MTDKPNEFVRSVFAFLGTQDEESALPTTLSIQEMERLMDRVNALKAQMRAEMDAEGNN